MDPERYLARIGIDSDGVGDLDAGTVARLQAAHVRAVPFENLAFVDDPADRGDSPGVSLSLPDLYEKVVERRRGGFCYELNGLFWWLLSELGADVTRAAARVFDADGDPKIPAGHLTLLADLDRRYVVDVGFGDVIRVPLPLSGEVRRGPDGAWRVAESDRPDADYEVHHRGADDDEWTPRFAFRDVHRPMSFFEAGCEYHQRAPAAPFTSDPVVVAATPEGRKTLSTRALTRTEGGETHREPVSPDEWIGVLEGEFDLRYPSR